MSQEFDAIFERGVFRPLQPVNLPERSKVHLQIHGGAPPEAASPERLAQQQLTLHELLDWLHSQPTQPALDPNSARQHDQMLYGWNK